MIEEYQSRGLQKCHVKGKFRWASGALEEGTWLIIGTEGESGLALQGKDKIIHIPKDGEFLKARLKPDPEKKILGGSAAQGLGLGGKHGLLFGWQAMAARGTGGDGMGTDTRRKNQVGRRYGRRQDGEDYRADLAPGQP